MANKTDKKDNKLGEDFNLEEIYHDALKDFEKEKGSPLTEEEKEQIHNKILSIEKNIKELAMAEKVLLDEENKENEKEIMEENVMIEMNSVQVVEGEEQEINLISKGVFYEDDIGFHMEYEETEATGFNGATSSITYEPKFDRVTMERDGENPTQITIEKGKRHICNYGTPYGLLTIGVRGCKIKSDLCANGGKLSFTYTLDVNTALASTNTININVVKENN